MAVVTMRPSPVGLELGDVKKIFFQTFEIRQVWWGRGFIWPDPWDDIWWELLGPVQPWPDVWVDVWDDGWDVLATETNTWDDLWHEIW